MTASVYDVLHLRYRLHKRLKPAQEMLARAIVASGKMRLDADNESNFVRLLLPAEGVDLTFTLREISEPKLLARSRERLLKLLLKRHDAQSASMLAGRYFEKVVADMGKRHKVKPETELMMARALVSCNAYPVIQLITLEGAEIFISFGQSVGDVMDMARWQEHGANSGLQASGGGENAVYVSCGGHPFLEKSEYRHSGDGPAALARFMIIAAQETGHNGDMIRGENGKTVGRYSAINGGRAPSEKAGKGRLSDIVLTEKYFDECRRFGLNRLVEWERHLKFYRDVKVRGWRWALAWLKSRLGWQVFKLLLRSRGMKAVTRLQRDAYPATLLRIFFADMLANLTPMADVYRRANAKEEEAIACIEAVARVPQQVVKWGHEAVSACTPALYALYYGEIVPACERVTQRITTSTA